MRVTLVVLLAAKWCLVLSQFSPVFPKGDLLYECEFSQADQVRDWRMEGPGELSFGDQWMHIYDPNEEGHHVLWCPQDFPESFVAQWELQNLETDAGLLIIFFAAHGENDRSIFDPSLAPRDGVFSKYTKSDIHNYHISYYAHTPNYQNRPYSHLRKNAGFHKVSIGGPPIPPLSRTVHRATLIKEGAHIRFYIDDRKLIDWTDDGDRYGPVLGRGKIGFRQMRWSHFRYRKFKVWSVDPVKRTSSTRWTSHIIDDIGQGADGIKLADFNRDGRQDIVTGWEESGETKLYLHPGRDHVKTPWPAQVVGATPSVEDALFIDMSGDEQAEIVSCTEGQSRQIFVHHLEEDSAVSGHWLQKKLPAASNKMKWMYATPMQIDRRYGVDLVAAGRGEGAALGWFAAPRRGGLRSWSWHEISPVDWIMSILTHDLDSDGDMDILITDRKGPLRGCRWLENPGNRKKQRGAWTNHFIGAKGLEVMFSSLTDIDGDGTPELIVPERTENTLRIYGMPKNPTSPWSEQVIKLPNHTGLAKAVAVGDLNGDHQLDLVLSTNTKGDDKDGLIWIDGRNLHSQQPHVFRSISGAHNAKFDDVILHDVDGDQDLDVMICEENFGAHSQGLGVIWYENKLNE